jgi:two-component system OmpR family response regulator
LDDESGETQPFLLVVDDDAETRDLISRYLEHHGVGVKTARDGDELAARMKRSRFDLILLDVMLPGANGFSICRDLRAQYSIPIIMLTAMNELADKLVGLEFGADDYISKPFEPSELLDQSPSAALAQQDGLFQRLCRWAGSRLSFRRHM